MADGKIAKDSVRKLAVETIKAPDMDMSEIAEKNNLTMLSEDDVVSIAMGPLMGMCMKQLKGKVDGSLVNKVVREEIQKLI